jgi:type VI secretion system protein ImpL
MFDAEVKQSFNRLHQVSTEQIQHLHSNLVHINKRQQQWRNHQGLKQGAFQWAFARFQKREHHDWLDQLAANAESLPQPLADSVMHFSQQYQQLLLTASTRYIQQQWRQQVYEPYQQQVAPYYPFNPEANVDLGLAKLKRFFGNDGVFDSFYQDYLRPFVNTDGSHWRLRVVNGTKLALTNADFADIMQALFIHRMFFDNKHSDPHASFTLVPTELAPQTGKVDLTMNGQAMHLTQEKMAMQDFTWPGDQTAAVTKITFTAKAGDESEETKSGVWGLFKLLDEMQLEPTDNPTRFKLVLDLNGQAVRLRLLASHRVNPFLMDLLHSFSPQAQL